MVSHQDNESCGALLSRVAREIEACDRNLKQHFKDALLVDSSLTRKLVSFQANKNLPVYRWYKYKEAFSAPLIQYLFERFPVRKGPILDPFAGMGTSLFVASELGFEGHGIELLPIGQELVDTRLCLQDQFTAGDMAVLKMWRREKPWKNHNGTCQINYFRITCGAYPLETEMAMGRYVDRSQQENTRVCKVLRLALLCVLESISFTRKDGQYLRWDYRSGRCHGKSVFDKGHIPDFSDAIERKLSEIIDDVEGKESQKEIFDAPKGTKGKITLKHGSCLGILPLLPSCTYEAIVTSPPYCNRYDYTRTYALELAMLGTNEEELLELRQNMISCTVENRAKDLTAINPRWGEAISAADDQMLLQMILSYLDQERREKRLNNGSIPRMVRGYFYEMACVIAECARILRGGGIMFLINDNVRYAGVSISVDMILSHIAESLGFSVKKILVLPQGKGNSSQQMGNHGRDVLRKCIYVWENLFDSRQ